MRGVKRVNSVDRPLYPEERHSYANKVGNVGELSVEVTFCDYLLSRPGVNVKGADLTSDHHSIGIEVWNHSKANAYVERAESVIKNLSSYEYKFLVTSFISEGIRKTIEQNDITVITLGFQILPAKYFAFYLKNGRMEGKRILTLRTLRILENRLAPITKIFEEKENENTVTYGYRDTHVCNEQLFPIEPSIPIKCPSTAELNKPTSNRIHSNSPAKLSRLTENRAIAPRLPEPQNNKILTILGTLLFLLPIYTIRNQFSRRIRKQQL